VTTGTSTELQERLDFLGLGTSERNTLKQMAPKIERLLDNALGHFYDNIRRTPQTRQFFKGDDHMATAGRAQKNHWSLILQGEFALSYLSAVKTVGSTHARIGLEPRWYVGGYSHVVESLVRGLLALEPEKKPRGLFRAAPENPDARQLLADEISVLLKAAFLDMELAISVYLEQLEVRREQAETQQVEALDRIAGALEQLAEGDLNVGVDAALSQKSQRLARSFNETVQSLREVINSVRGTSAAVNKPRWSRRWLRLVNWQPQSARRPPKRKMPRVRLLRSGATPTPALQSPSRPSMRWARSTIHPAKSPRSSGLSTRSPFRPTFWR
jgi:methyl-accepting chemotaxis protein